MTSKAVSYTKHSANEDVVLNSGRVKEGVAKAGSAEIDVEKTLSLLNEAMGGKLFQAMDERPSNMCSEDEVITVCESKSSSSHASKPKQKAAAAQSSHSQSEEESKCSQKHESEKQTSENWLARLTAKIMERAS